MFIHHPLLWWFLPYCRLANMKHHWKEVCHSSPQKKISLRSTALSIRTDQTNNHHFFYAWDSTQCLGGSFKSHTCSVTCRIFSIYDWLLFLSSFHLLLIRATVLRMILWIQSNIMKIINYRFLQGLWMMSCRTCQASLYSVISTNWLSIKSANLVRCQW